jgi:hypothetical protein
MVSKARVELRLGEQGCADVGGGADRIGDGAVLVGELRVVVAFSREADDPP